MAILASLASTRKQFEMAFVKRAILIGENGHGADGAIVGHQRNAAETSAEREWVRRRVCRASSSIIVANQHRLTRANDVFGEVIAGRAGALGHAIRRQ